MNREKHEEIKETGTIEITKETGKIKVFTIIGEIEGHELANSNTK